MMKYAPYVCNEIWLEELIILMDASYSRKPVSVDSSYIVQIHAEQSHYAEPEDKVSRRKMMTSANGQDYECILPYQY